MTRLERTYISDLFMPATSNSNLSNYSNASIRDQIVEYKDGLLRQLIELQTQISTKSDNFSNDNDTNKRHEQVKNIKSGEMEDKEENLALESAPEDEKINIRKRKRTISMDMNVKSMDEQSEEYNNAPVSQDDDEENLKLKVDVELNRDNHGHLDTNDTPTIDETNVSQNGQEKLIDEEMKDEENNKLQPTEDSVLSPPKKKVLRTSVPNEKYLVSGLEDRSSYKYTADAEMQPRLLRPIQDVNFTHSENDSKRATIRSRALTSDQIHGDFESKLRLSTRLHKDIHNRTHVATRKRQLPRLITPQTTKTHWDNLLMEMQLIATDFSSERKWKRELQSRIAREVIIAQNAERVRQEKDRRHTAREIASQVSSFWRTIEPIAARSRMRFESNEMKGDTFISSKDSLDSKAAKKYIGDNEKNMGSNIQGKSDTITEFDSHENGSTKSVAIQYKNIDLSGETVDQAQVQTAKKRTQYIVAAGKRARDQMVNMHHEDISHDIIIEKAIQKLQIDYQHVALAGFHILALRWMFELHKSGLNMLLNDQVGMGKAVMISAFLRLVELSETTTNMDGPHLVIVSADELHMWTYYLRLYHPGKKFQLYRGSASERKRLQRSWNHEENGHSDFLNDVLDDSPHGQTLYCCICPIENFVPDQETFLSFKKWQVVVVSNESDPLFNDEECLKALNQISQVKRRVLCSSQPIESWASNFVRLRYAEFLLGDAELTKNKVIADLWTNHLILEKVSILQIIDAMGKTASSVWKSHNEHMCALLIPLCCLSLRRIRSEVESQLGKIEESSVSCKLSTSQNTQYTNTLNRFTASRNSSEAFDAWCRLFIELRRICNCVDLMNDLDKLGHADINFITSCSSKLEVLSTLLKRLLTTENKRVVIYSQVDAMFPIVEVFLSLLDITFVKITGSPSSVQHSLCHFALYDAVKVALAPTRLSCTNGSRIMPIFGADAIIVLDSDWNATCDTKLRASWARTVIVKELPIYRFHCEQTIEASLLRFGACLTEKVLAEVTPQEFVGSDFYDLGNSIEKPSWWSSTGLKNITNSSVTEVTSRIEKQEQYCCTELGTPLCITSNIDAEEHLLLANTDELTPVEWYAVNYIHCAVDKRLAHNTEADLDSGFRVHEDGGRNSDASTSTQSFEQIVVLDNKRRLEAERAEDLLFYPSAQRPEVSQIHQPFQVVELLRANGDEFVPTLMNPLNPQQRYQNPLQVSDQMIFQIMYRVPTPPVTAPNAKLRGDMAALQYLEHTKNQKQKMPGKMGNSNSVKRKLDDSNAIMKPLEKHQRVHTEGITSADMSESESFWSETNWDAVDSISWEDPSVRIALGSEFDSNMTVRVPSHTTGSSSQSRQPKKNKLSGTGMRGGRKGNDLRDGWTAKDDNVLKILFDQYGPNWALIARVFNSSTAVSRYFCKKRSARQCYERYEKLLSGNATVKGGKVGGNNTKLKSSKPNVGNVSISTSLPQTPLQSPPTTMQKQFPLDETLLIFATHNKLPGLPPPSVSVVPSSKENNTNESSMQLISGESIPTSENLRPIRYSFDAIIQCMKRKTSPQTSTNLPNTELDTNQKQLAKGNSNGNSDRGSKLSGSTSFGQGGESVIPPPHQSHFDIASQFPTEPLSPGEVIKRSKEVVAAAVVSAGRKFASIPATSENSLSVFSSNVTAPRRNHSHSNVTSSGARVYSENYHSLPVQGSNFAVVTNPNNLKESGSGRISAWGDMSGVQQGNNRSGNPILSGNTTGHDISSSSSMVPGTGVRLCTTSDMNNAQTANSIRSTGIERNAMNVTSSGLYDALNRKPQIKNKIQIILNRNDCPQDEKVAMIARLLHNNSIPSTVQAASATDNSSISSTGISLEASRNSSQSHPQQADALSSSSNKSSTKNLESE